MTHYLIEFRFSGYVKGAIRELKDNISRNYHVNRRKIVPHITLVGPLYTRNEKQLVEEVKNIAKRYDLVKFSIDGFDSFENRVIYVRIRPSEELQKLRLELKERLEKFCELSEHDFDRNFTFHATLVFKDIQIKFDKIWDFLQTWKIPKMDQYILRIAIIKDYKILAEYDLMQRKVLNRSQALDKKTLQKSISKLEKKQETPEIEFEDIPEKKKIFVISDTHFDHTNVIRFSDRPFASTRHMNQQLISRWNSTVNNDTVYFLGDMSLGRRRRPIDYWLGKLGGQIYCLRGNHDSDIIQNAPVIHDRYGIKYHDYKFLLMHHPWRPHGYDGWIIHGHTHNTSMKNHPFLHQKNKTINVSSELIDYTPITLDRIISLIETGRSYKTMNG
jgi:calcineurin-like phosphoesterase family protein/2'-5' RNA ligase